VSLAVALRIVGLARNIGCQLLAWGKKSCLRQRKRQSQGYQTNSFQRIMVIIARDIENLNGRGGSNSSSLSTSPIKTNKE